MFVERLTLTSFRCFGQAGTSIPLDSTLTAFIGDNGTGKTAVLQAMQRLFGVTAEQRRMRRQDFHVPSAEIGPVTQRGLVIEAFVAFPELDADADSPAVPEFFRHMAADEHGNLKCRLRLQATWVDDGTLDGAIEEKYWAIRTFGDFADEDCVELKGADRARIQLIYVPATRDGASQVAAFLRSRLWRAINWSAGVQDALSNAGVAVNEAFSGEAAIQGITAAVTTRWQQMYSAGTDSIPIFRPVDTRWQEFIRKVEVVFHPDELGRERELSELSDGQRSLFHLAMTAATLDIEAQLRARMPLPGFVPDGVAIPALTIIAVEEPENNLAPFYLSRIVKQVEEVANGSAAQAVISSHSPSILARVAPEQVRHFRLDLEDRTSRVRSIRMPEGQEDASKFVREAVRTYPELYFARFVLLGEGATEEVVLPQLANALGFPIDRSFVALVPLGGRHVNHLWRLLTDLDIPYSTLLDLDWGRSGGGFGRVKTACKQLLETGVKPEQLFAGQLSVEQNLAELDARGSGDTVTLAPWLTMLRTHNVFFSAPLDLDYLMLFAYTTDYQVLEPGANGPSNRGDPREAVLGDEGTPALYGPDQDALLRWYRYLFLGRGKPSTHVRVLSNVPNAQLAAQVPEPLSALLNHMQTVLEQAAAR